MTQHLTTRNGLNLSRLRHCRRVTGSKEYKYSQVDELCVGDDPVLGEGRNNNNRSPGRFRKV